MVNYGVVLLIFLAVIITIGIIVLLSWAAVESNKTTPTTNQPFTSLSCPKTINTSALIQIPDVGSDCITTSGTGDLYYIGKLGTYDYVVAPFVRQAFDVCIAFCTSYTGGTCSGPDYNGQSAQSNFNKCMNQLSCNFPLATRGQILYYPFSPTCNICSNCPQLS